MKKTLIETIEQLSNSRPIFHSEADFLLALGLELGHSNNFKIRLEYPMEVEYKYPNNKKRQRAYIDIVIETPNEKIGIELKYKTKGRTIELDSETYQLKEQGARDVGRFLFRQDIYRLEQLVNLGELTQAFAIMLTNELKYPKEEINQLNLDGQFRLGSSEIPKKADWNTSIKYYEKHYTFDNETKQWLSKKSGKPCWIYGQEFSKNLNLSKSYICKWKNYSVVSDEVFKYLIVEI